MLDKYFAKICIKLKHNKKQMINFNQLQNEEHTKVKYALAYLFSPALTMEEDFVNNLTAETINDAFAVKSKKFNISSNKNLSIQEQEKNTARYQKIKNSLNLLKNYFPEGSIVEITDQDINDLSKESSKEDSSSQRKRKILAVGGAKGGVGKSIFSTNLSVYLSSLVKKVIIIDLDLGGSTLNLYFGLKKLKYTINDYLNGKINSLEAAITKTQYGPLLIGGDSSRLGSANIAYLKKLKLLRAIKRLDADYIILDLGASTSYNMLDFFLSADQGIIITTTDPPAYMEAYAFIKVALYRNLSRIFANSKQKQPSDYQLQNIIKKYLCSDHEPLIEKISELEEIIKKEHPQGYPIFINTLKSFSPKLVINMVDKKSNDLKISEMLKSVARSNLNINIEYICSIDNDEKIKDSAKTLRPVLFDHKNNTLSLKLKIFCSSIN